MKKNVLFVALVAALAFAVTFGATLWFGQSRAEQAYDKRDLEVNGKPAMPDFTLTDMNGQPFSLSQLNGKMTLLYWGYTHCPDVCPLSLADYKRIKELLGADAERVAFVFITVDGERDTPSVLKRYVSAFDPSFIGLTGTPAQVRAVSEPYGVRFEKSADATADSYTMLHTSFMAVLDKQQRWRQVYPFQYPVDAISSDIKRLLKE